VTKGALASITALQHRHGGQQRARWCRARPLSFARPCVAAVRDAALGTDVARAPSRCIHVAAQTPRSRQGGESERSVVAASAAAVAASPIATDAAAIHRLGPLSLCGRCQTGTVPPRCHWCGCRPPLPSSCNLLTCCAAQSRAAVTLPARRLAWLARTNLQQQGAAITHELDRAGTHARNHHGCSICKTLHHHLIVMRHCVGWASERASARNPKGPNWSADRCGSTTIHLHRAY